MNRGTGINVGSSSILMIFVLLCLATFSTLSLVSANADYKLTVKTAQSVSAYYAADARAEEFLASIDGILKKSAENKDTFAQRAAAGLSEIGGCAVTGSPEGLTVEYQVPVDDRRALRVLLEVPMDSTDGRYRVVSWQVIQTGQWEEDGTLNLWDGQDAAFFGGGQTIMDGEKQPWM